MALYLFPIDHLPLGHVYTGRDLVEQTNQSWDMQDLMGGWRLTDYPIWAWGSNSNRTYNTWLYDSKNYPGRRSTSDTGGQRSTSTLGLMFKSTDFVTEETDHLILGVRISRYDPITNGIHSFYIRDVNSNAVHTYVYEFTTDRPDDVYLELHIRMDTQGPSLEVWVDGVSNGLEVLSASAITRISSRVFNIHVRAASGRNVSGAELMDFYVATDTPAVDPQAHPAIDDSNHTSPLGPISYQSVGLTPIHSDFTPIDPALTLEEMLRLGITSGQYPYQEYIYSDAETTQSITVDVDYSSVPTNRVLATHISVAGMYEGASSGIMSGSTVNGLVRDHLLTQVWDINRTVILEPNMTGPVTITFTAE